MEKPYCDRCYNTGELDCYCGGDLCICERNGTYECPSCSRQNGFACDGIDDDYEDQFDGYDAGEWNNEPEQPSDDTEGLRRVLGEALAKNKTT